MKRFVKKLKDTLIAILLPKTACDCDIKVEKVDKK